VYVPDGSDERDALERTTDLGVGAHPDDLELLMVVPIARCLAAGDRSFTGIVCTNGAGSVRAGAYADLTDAEMVEVRRAEQRRAADVGSYGAVVQLGHPSASVRDRSTSGELVDDVRELLVATRPSNVYTHNPADKHATHVAVAAAVVRAVRSMPAEQRPNRLVGVEAWRDLDWLDDHEKVLLDATGLDDLAATLAACFPSQIEGGKRYDLASEGRRRANATMRDPRAADGAEQLSVAFELTPLIRNDDLDPVRYVTGAIDRFKRDVESSLRAAFD